MPARPRVLALTVKPEPSELARKVILLTLPSARLTPLNLALSAAFCTWSRSEVKSDTKALNEAVFSEVSEAARAFSFIFVSRSVMVSPAARATSIVD